MKSLFLTLLLLNAVAAAVDRPSGFAGIPWGASPEEAKRALQARPGVKFPEDSDDYHVEVTGGIFAGQQVTKWVLEFPERKFASASVTMKTEGNASAVFKDLRTGLISKYGSPATEKKLTTNGNQTRPPPGRHSLGTIATWKFTPTMKEKSKIAISAELAGPGGKPAEESQLSVTIRYINESLSPAATGTAAGAKTAHAPVKKEDL